MRMSWVVAGALFLLTWVFASMELQFLSVATFLLLVMTAMAGYYKPEYAMAAQQNSPEKKHFENEHANAHDPNDSEGANPIAHSQTHHSEKKHSGSEHAHSEKKHYEEHSGNAHAHSEKKHSEKKRFNEYSHSHDTEESDV